MACPTNARRWRAGLDAPVARRYEQICSLATSVRSADYGYWEHASRSVLTLVRSRPRGFAGVQAPGERFLGKWFIAILTARG